MRGEVAQGHRAPRAPGALQRKPHSRGCACTSDIGGVHCEADSRGWVGRPHTVVELDTPRSRDALVARKPKRLPENMVDDGRQVLRRQPKSMLALV